MDRRNFLKTLGVASGTALVKASPLKANSTNTDSNAKRKGVLVDTTLCVGCRGCEEICAEVNHLPEPDLDIDILKIERKTSLHQYSIVNGYETEKGEIYVKRQCMHCNVASCATACLTKAMYKTEEGPVIWRGDKCMGCRYCMVACPFEMPRYEYDSPNPEVTKCSMCFDRLQEGEQPACVENCPAEAIIYGDREDLLEIAKTRIYNNPDDYVHHIYGEHEVGGTSWMYLSAVPFDQIGFRTDLGTTPPAEHTKDFLYSVPVVLTLWPAFLLAMHNSTKSENDTTESEG